MADLPVTFGRSQRTLSVGGFRITEARYEPGLRVAPHRHRFPSWTAVLEGGFDEQFRREAVKAVPGTLFAKPADALHSDTYGRTGARVIVVEMTDDAGSETGVSEAFNDVRVLRASVATHAVTRLQAQLSTAPATGSLGIHATLLDFARLLLRGGARAPAVGRGQWLTAVESRLREEFANAPSLVVLAQDAGVHPVHLCTAFRARFGCSPGEFVRRRQLEQAQHLLTHSLRPISAIAHQVGFADHSHLVRRFRVAFGVTPSAYRRLTARP